MKIKTSSLCWMLALSGTILPLASPAMAQNAVTPGAGGRLSVVELRDTTLADALELIFKAAGNPSHIIDESAQTIQIPSITLNNIAWDGAVRNLTNLNGFKVSRNGTGAWVVEPRAPIAPEGGFTGEGGIPFAPNPSMAPGNVPANPFGNRRPPRATTQASPSIRTFANSQTRPNTGNGRAGTTTANEGKDYQIIIVRHIYAGGLAQLFGNSSVIRTEDFVSPGSGSGGSGGGGNRGGRSGGGIGGGGGGIGGGIGGGGAGGGIGGIGGGIGGGGFGGGGFGGGGTTGGTGGGGGGFGGGFGF